MKKLLLTQILILVYSFCSIGQDIEDIDKFHYHSDFEKKVFNEYFMHGKKDHFALFLCSDPGVDEEVYIANKRKLDDALHKFNKYYAKGLKPSKEVKKLYSVVHDNLFELYNERADLVDLFDKKNYNCVSGSMLYCLAFDRYGIPYEIHEIPEHVYLNAYPNSYNINVETTNPVKGVTTHADGFKSRYIKYMRQSKRISAEEMSKKTIDQLFNEYYLRSEVLTKTNLAGIQYTNLALEEFESQDFLEAYYLLEKAYFLYPVDRISFLLQFSLLLAIEGTDNMDPGYAGLISKVCAYEGLLFTRDNLLATFQEITNRQLVYEGKQDFYSQSYNTILSGISDSTTSSEISFIYNLEMGRYNIRQGKFNEALPYIEEAYSLKSSNVDSKLLFVHAVTNSFVNRRMDGSYGEEILNKLTNYSEKYPALNDQYEFERIKILLSLELMDYYYFQGNSEKGEYYKNYFENTFNRKYLDYAEIRILIAKAYSTGAGYYFKNGRTKSTRNILQKGLEYLPDNFQLKSRLNAL